MPEPVRHDEAVLRPARPEHHRHAVHAIALAGRLGPVVEDVPQMPATPRAMDLGARHQQLAIRAGADRVRQRRPETRPDGAAVERGCRRIRPEERCGGNECDSRWRYGWSWLN